MHNTCDADRIYWSKPKVYWRSSLRTVLPRQERRSVALNSDCDTCERYTAPAQDSSPGTDAVDRCYEVSSAPLALRLRLSTRS